MGGLLRTSLEELLLRTQEERLQQLVAARRSGCSASSQLPMAAASVAPGAAALVTQASLPTPEELEACYRRCVELKSIIVSRHAGGKEKSQGCYKKHDSARLHFIKTTVEPGLKVGRLPLEWEQRLLFDYPGDEDIKGPAKHEMDFWSDRVKPRGGRQAAAAAAPDERGQTNMLRWAHMQDPYLTSAGAEYSRRGRPPCPAALLR